MQETVHGTNKIEVYGQNPGSLQYYHVQGLWSFILRCFPTSDFGLLDPISVQWPGILCIRVFLVWPTYCFWHFRHCMQWIKFLDLQAIFFLHLYSLPLNVLVMLPSVLRFSEYLHFPVLDLHLFFSMLGTIIIIIIRHLYSALSSMSSRALHNKRFRAKNEKHT